MTKPQTSNIQDSFFNQIRKDRAFATIYLVNGIKLTGKIKSFDKFTVILENKSQEQMIFKHAISTISSQKPGFGGDYRESAGPTLRPPVPDKAPE
jgi:host factor-I protein